MGDRKLRNARGEIRVSWSLTLFLSLLFARRCCALTFFPCMAHSSFIRCRNEVPRKPRAHLDRARISRFFSGLRADDDAMEIVPLPSHPGPHRPLRFRMLSRLVSSANARYARRPPMSRVYIAGRYSNYTRARFHFVPVVEFTAHTLRLLASCVIHIEKELRVSGKKNKSRFIDSITFQFAYACFKNIYRLSRIKWLERERFVNIFYKISTFSTRLKKKYSNPSTRLFYQDYIS